MYIRFTIPRPILLCIWLLNFGTTSAEPDTKPLLHPLFWDNAVLQRDRPITIWGWADAGEEVVVSFAGQTKRTNAGKDGKWTCVLDPLAASSEGRRLEVETESGDIDVAMNILVGDVWLCSGQSNMEMGITLCKEDDEIAKANYPGIRLISIPQTPEFKPKESFSAQWQPCSPESLRTQGLWGGFSATAYFFGKKLHEELDIPVGLIHSSLGGTIIEAWASAPALEDYPEFKPELDKVAAVAASKAADPKVEYLNAWFNEHDPGTFKEWHEPDTNDSAWREVNFPGNWGDFGIPGFEGVVWARRHFEIPADWADKPLVVSVGEISDNDTTWLNGKVIGRTNQFGVARRYETEKGIAKPGKNTIALRVTNSGGGNIMANNNPLSIYPVGEENSAISLAGKWRFQETAKKADTGRPMVGNPNIPSVLYNGMIAPLVPYTMTGVIWYQGEANASRAHQYRELLPTLIDDWRNQFQRDDLAFHIVSLASYQKRHDKPRDDSWAELREAQAMTSKKLAHCGLAVTIDIGDAADIHPKNKRDVGKRLALTALKDTYGKDLVASGPWFKSIEAQDGQIRIHFDHIDGGLKFKGTTEQSFAIAGENKEFHWAKASIDGNSVVVSSPAVPKPVAVRYAWDINPEACLYNGAGLPAVPFRSDDWPMITKGKKTRVY